MTARGTGYKRKNDERKVELVRRCLALNRRADVYVSNANNYVYLPDINGMAQWRHHGGLLHRVSMPRHYPVIIGTQIFPD